SKEAVSRPGVSDSRRRKRIPNFEALDLLDVPPRTLAAPLQLAMPCLLDLTAEADERPRIRRYTVVIAVPPNHGTQPPMLRRQWVVHSLSPLRAQHPHLRRALLPGGTALQWEPALSPSPAIRSSLAHRRPIERVYCLACGSTMTHGGGSLSRATSS